MQLTICLYDGRQFPFSVADGPAAAEFLGRVKYWEVFDRPVLRIHDGKATWAFKPASIEKILFMTTQDPGWSPPENIIAAKCINAETYRRKLAALEAQPQATADQFKDGKFIDALFTFTMASGA